MEILTSGEAADYLRLKERKLYELVATGAVPCTKVTGRWLFPKAELDRWIMASLAQPANLSPAEPPPIVGGSHDPLLEWALLESGSALATLPEGSERGLDRFLAGEVAAAAIHLHTLDNGDIDANVEAVRRSVKTHDAVLIAFVRREQGFVVAPGNPLGVSAIIDIVDRRARLALRPKGAGAQLLLLALLHRAGVTFESRLGRYARPDPISPRRSGPVMPTAGLRRDRSRARPASASCRSCGRISTSCCISAIISGSLCRSSSVFSARANSKRARATPAATICRARARCASPLESRIRRNRFPALTRIKIGEKARS